MFFDSLSPSSLRFQCSKMVQQTTDSKFNEYGLNNAETGLPKHDKQLPVVLAAKKTALRDLNDNIRMVPNSVRSPLLHKEIGPSVEAVKLSGSKRAQTDCSLSSSNPHSPASNTSNGHLVYVRRKSEAEPGKSSTDDITSINGDCPQSGLHGHQHEKIMQQLHIKDSKICVPESAPIVKSSSDCFSSRKPSGPLPLGNFSYTSPLADTSYFHIKSTIPSLENPKITNIQDRYCRLQNLLKILDQSNQDDYIQMLRSLSSVELSRHAVELEKRSIQLSLEEGKELQRVRVLDVLGKYPKNFKATSTQQKQSDK